MLYAEDAAHRAFCAEQKNVGAGLQAPIDYYVISQTHTTAQWHGMASFASDHSTTISTLHIARGGSIFDGMPSAHKMHFSANGSTTTFIERTQCRMHCVLCCVCVTLMHGRHRMQHRREKNMLKSHTDCAYTFVRAPSQLLRACNRPIIAH